MNVRLGLINGILQNLNNLSDHVLPARLSYAITYNKDKLRAEAERCEKERIKICERYAEKDEEGNNVFEETANGQQTYRLTDQKSFTEELSALLNTEVDVPIRTVTWDLIEKAIDDDKYTSLSMGEISVLEFMVESDE